MNQTIFPPDSDLHEVIELNISHLDSCIALDKLVLQGFWSKSHWEKELIDPQRLCIGIIQYSQLIAIASGWLVLNEVQLTLIEVHPKYQRKGLGQLVLSGLLCRAYELGIRSATLEVAIDNESAKALYRKCGFEIVGLRRGFYKNGKDALMQTKKMHTEPNSP